MIPLALSLLVAILLGSATAFACVPHAMVRRQSLFLHAILSGVAGLGLSSCLFFFWLVVAGKPSSAILVVELFLAALCAGVGLFRLRSSCPRPTSDDPPNASRPAFSFVRWCLILSFGIGLFIWTDRFIDGARRQPHGAWDAWAIWNSRARMFVLAGENWDRAMSHNTEHPDYPLFLPLSIARCWTLMSSVSAKAPLLFAGAFSLGLPVLLLAIVARLRGVEQGLLAAIFLLGMTAIGSCSWHQYADLPLAFIILCSLSSTALFDATSRRGYLVIGGLLAGIAAWTKNEGALFLVSLLCSRLLVSLFQQGMRGAVREAAAFLLGASVPIACLMLFKTCYAPPNYLFQNNGTALSRLIEADRYVLIAKAYFGQIVSLGVWRGRIGCAVLVGYAMLAGIKVGGRKAAVMNVGLPIFLILAGYFVVYLITPLSLEWHLTCSVDRLFLHVLPGLVLFYFLIVRAPGEPREDANATATAQLSLGIDPPQVLGF